MTPRKVLFIAQEITPYVPQTNMSVMVKKIPQAIQEMGSEIRTFLPKWGNINERRNQLHEVIRLSGMNIIINDTDHPLLIKVASLQSARMQVYFIDNEDFFQKRLMVADKKGKEYTDNYERAIFYARSVLETIKKLRWYPDVIHCQGWVSAIAPYYIKTAYREEPPFANTKVVFSLYDMPLTKSMPDNFRECIAFRSITPEIIDTFGLNFKTTDDLIKLAINFSDGVVETQPNTNPEWINFAKTKNIPILEYNDETENQAQRFSDFYDSILNA